MIRRRSVFCLGLVQLVSWGVSYYLIGVFGDAIAADLGWSQTTVHAGFSAALLVMGLSSPLAGSLIDRYGGRRVMMIGAALNAAGCALLAVCENLPVYFTAWLLLGLGMRLTLYDAAFAALARIGGPAARRPMSQITLLGGLASTTFWPLGYLLIEQLGWRGALGFYAVLALSAVPLLIGLPDGRYDAEAAPREPRVAPLAANDRERFVAGALYALIVTLANFLASGLSAHMIPILTGLGVGAAAAVSISALRGIGQSLARLCEVLFGRHVHPLALNIIGTLLLPFCFVAGLWSGESIVAAVAFAFFYGAGNGLLTIARGTLPLVLFDPRTYGSFVGRLLTPSFLLSAAAPLIYAWAISRFGEVAALYISLAAGLAALSAALYLNLAFRAKGPSAV
ncbi:MFS transporter [Hyphomicrobium sp. LHD-15]|uniref:MFS transporter n=1 Tax=Hyphomicrobium sp. LHD-15 TaxID=3072142 RepID=UPI00280E4FF1|nr:MFS transporter [Hyphomicrobium sp. LHD-15]MDQ8700387.1 MFS transporter [Hyphomicrobium sp. LHD-15]